MDITDHGDSELGSKIINEVKVKVVKFYDTWEILESYSLINIFFWSNLFLLLKIY